MVLRTVARLEAEDGARLHRPVLRLDAACPDADRRQAVAVEVLIPVTSTERGAMAGRGYTIAV